MDIQSLNFLSATLVRRKSIPWGGVFLSNAEITAAVRGADEDALIRDLAFPALDGLRFYAALLVFLVHSIGAMMTEYFQVPAEQFNYNSPNPLYDLAYFLADGHHGVDIFFVISGFLMARIIFARDVGWLEFVKKRFIRIYPAFLASIVLIVLVKYFMFGWEIKPAHLLGNLLFLNAFPDLGVTAYNHVSWSLGYEFSFYLVIPMLAVVARYLDRRVVTAAVLILVCVFVPNPLIRFTALFAGLFVGSLAVTQLRAIARYVPAALLLAWYACLVIMKGYRGLPYREFLAGMIMVSSLGLVVIAYGDNFLGRFLSRPSLRKLGALSYSFYLYHSIVILFVIHYFLPWLGVSRNPWMAVPVLFVSSFLITITVASWSYALFEAPYFKKKPKVAAVVADVAT